MLQSKEWRRMLGAKISEQFKESHRYYRSRYELQFPTVEGHNSVYLDGNFKYSPDIHLTLYFGCFYESLGDTKPKPPCTYAGCHIWQNGWNLDSLKWIKYDHPCSWRVKLDELQPEFVNEVVSAIRGVAFEFFARFPNEQSARQAFSEDTNFDLFETFAGSVTNLRECSSTLRGIDTSETQRAIVRISSLDDPKFTRHTRKRLGNAGRK